MGLLEYLFGPKEDPWRRTDTPAPAAAEAAAFANRSDVIAVEGHASGDPLQGKLALHVVTRQRIVTAGSGA